MNNPPLHRGALKDPEGHPLGPLIEAEDDADNTLGTGPNADLGTAGEAMAWTSQG